MHVPYSSSQVHYTGEMNKDGCDPFTAGAAKNKKVDDLPVTQKDWVEMKISGLLPSALSTSHGFSVLISHRHHFLCVRHTSVDIHESQHQ